MMRKVLAHVKMDEIPIMDRRLWSFLTHSSDEYMHCPPNRLDIVMCLLKSFSHIIEPCGRTVGLTNIANLML